MDEFEKRLMLEGARKSITETINAFNPTSLLSGAKGYELTDEVVADYKKKWVDMAKRSMFKAEALSQGYADLVIAALGLKVIAQPETTPSNI